MKIVSPLRKEGRIRRMAPKRHAAATAGALLCRGSHGRVQLADDGLRLHDHQRPRPFWTTGAEGQARTGVPSGSAWVWGCRAGGPRPAAAGRRAPVPDHVGSARRNRTQREKPEETGSWAQFTRRSPREGGFCKSLILRTNRILRTDRIYGHPIYLMETSLILDATGDLL